MVSEKRGVSIPMVIVAAIAIALSGIGLWYASQPRQPALPPGINAAAKAYVANLGLSGVEMKAATNFAGAMVVEIVGNISNKGTRTLDRVELNCVFYDPNGTEVLRQRVAIVRSTLTPGETKSFRLPFEGIPEGWNQVLPQLVIASISFAS
ncbi:MAG: FxLYD domain-containing protein [Bryobacteraceae bacterium]